MNQKKTVTIGICVRDSELTIKKAVKSIINQNFSHELMQIIVVDGYSRDETLVTIRNILSTADIPFKIFQDDRGLGQARQIVFENAQGKYIIWVDGDMVLTKDFVKKNVGFMERNPNVGIAVGQHVLSPNDNWIALLEIIEDVIDFNANRQRTNRPLGAGGSIYRVSALRQIGGFNSYIRVGEEDTDVENRMRASGWPLKFSLGAKFYEKAPSSWGALWRKYCWYGYGGHFALHEGLIKRYKLFPPVTLFTVLLRSILAYKLTSHKIFFLLPLHYLFKRVAWLVGLVRAHRNGYGHLT